MNEKLKNDIINVG